MWIEFDLKDLSPLQLQSFHSQSDWRNQSTHLPICWDLRQNWSLPVKRSDWEEDIYAHLGKIPCMRQGCSGHTGLLLTNSPHSTQSTNINLPLTHLEDITSIPTDLFKPMATPAELDVPLEKNPRIFGSSQTESKQLITHQMCFLQYYYVCIEM